MDTMAELFDQALQHHQSGRLAQAEPLYRQILEVDPGHAHVLHLMGILCNQTGRTKEAMSLIGQAIARNPSAANYHLNLGTVYRVQGRRDEEIACYRRALALDPNYVDAHNNLGTALLGQGQPEQAIACYRQALAIDPNHAGAHNNLGIALKGQGHMAEAIASYRQVLRINPGHAPAHYNLGIALEEQGQLAEATESYRQAVRLNAGFADAHCNLGKALTKQGQNAAATECYRQTLRINPNHAIAHNNLGLIHCQNGQVEEAIASFQQALQISPNYMDAHNNLASILFDQGQFAEAARCFERALGVDPSHRLLRANRSLLRLLQGDFAGGWPDYEERLAQPGSVQCNCQQPRWDGSPLGGKRILVYPEQGLGDTIQFARYLPLVKERGGQVVFECQPEIAGLLGGMAGIDQLAQPSTRHAVDYHVPLLSLPGIFGTTLATIPADVPYLFADTALCEYWRGQLQAVKGFKIGIIWQGNPKHPRNSTRSVPLVHFEKLTHVSGVSIVSLQKGGILAEGLPILDLGDRLETCSDTAAVMKNLDLVISVDTAGAHLAGALGVPVWTVLAAVPDWRWLLGRSDSPWYPTMRLFRQRKSGEWGEVFERMAAALNDMLGI